MSKPKKTYKTGLRDGEIKGIQLVKEHLIEYRTLVGAIALGETNTEEAKNRLLGGVAGIESMLEIVKSLLTQKVDETTEGEAVG